MISGALNWLIEGLLPMNLLDFNRIKQITTATQRQESELKKKKVIITITAINIIVCLVSRSVMSDPLQPHGL